MKVRRPLIQWMWRLPLFGLTAAIAFFGSQAVLKQAMSQSLQDDAARGRSVSVANAPQPATFQDNGYSVSQPAVASTKAQNLPAGQMPPSSFSVASAPRAAANSFQNPLQASATQVTSQSIPSQNFQPAQLTWQTYTPQQASNSPVFYGDYSANQAAGQISQATQRILQKWRSLDNNQGPEETQLKLAAELKEQLALEFDEKYATHQNQVEALEKQLQNAKELLAKRQKKKDEIVARRASQLLGQVDDLSWEWTPPAGPSQSPPRAQPYGVQPYGVPTYGVPAYQGHLTPSAVSPPVHSPDSWNPNTAQAQPARNNLPTRKQNAPRPNGLTPAGAATIPSPNSLPGAAAKQSLRAPAQSTGTVMPSPAGGQQAVPAAITPAAVTPAAITPANPTIPQPPSAIPQPPSSIPQPPSSIQQQPVIQQQPAQLPTPAASTENTLVPAAAAPVDTLPNATQPATIAPQSSDVPPAAIPSADLQPEPVDTPLVSNTETQLTSTSAASADSQSAAKATDDAKGQ